MNVWHIISHLGAIAGAALDLVSKVLALHNDPKFQALIQSDPEISAIAASISADARTIQNGLR